MAAYAEAKSWFAEGGGGIDLFAIPREFAQFGGELRNVARPRTSGEPSASLSTARSESCGCGTDENGESDASLPGDQTDCCTRGSPDAPRNYLHCPRPQEVLANDRPGAPSVASLTGADHTRPVRPEHVLAWGRQTTEHDEAGRQCTTSLGAFCCMEIWCEPVYLGLVHCAIIVQACDGSTTSFELRRILRRITGNILEDQGAETRSPAYIVRDNVPLDARGRPTAAGWKFHNDWCVPCDGCLDPCVLSNAAIAAYPHLSAAYNELGPNSNTFASWYAAQVGYTGPAPAHAPGW